MIACAQMNKVRAFAAFLGQLRLRPASDRHFAARSFAPRGGTPRGLYEHYNNRSDYEWTVHQARRPLVHNLLPRLEKHEKKYVVKEPWPNVDPIYMREDQVAARKHGDSEAQFQRAKAGALTMPHVDTDARGDKIGAILHVLKGRVVRHASRVARRACAIVSLGDHTARARRSSWVGMPTSPTWTWTRPCSWRAWNAPSGRTTWTQSGATGSAGE